MLVQHVAIINKSNLMTTHQFLIGVAALQKQIVRDVGPIWGFSSTVNAFSHKLDVPDDYWCVYIQDSIDEAPGMSGYHDDRFGQPFAIVQYDERWTFTTSHELIEMLVDPFGRRMVAGWVNGERVNILVEACDPCSDEVYSVNSSLVSDFVTPAYYGPVKVPGERYSFSGKIDGPRELKHGGYYSWLHGDSGEWYQKSWFDDKPSVPVIDKLGRLTIVNGNCRSAIDRATRARRAKHELVVS